MKKPLKAPTSMPVPTPTAVQSRIEASKSAGSMVVARTTLTSDSTAPADRSKPPERMTMVWPTAASASVAPPLDRKLTSK